MSWRTAVKWALVVALTSWPLVTEAAPRAKRSRGRTSPQHELDATAKKVDLFKAIDAKQVTAQFVAQSPGLAVLRLVNESEEPLTVEVPLMLGAKPQLPPGGSNQNVNLALYGTTQVPHVMAGVVSPQWSNVGVEKKRVKRKGPRRPAKPQIDGDSEGDASPDEAAAGGDSEDDARPAAKRRSRKPARTDDEPDEEKLAEPKKPQDSTVAVVPLPVGGEQDLPMMCVGLELGKPQPRPAAPYTITELEEATKATEIKTLLEQLGQGKILDTGAAQVLAWRYTSRKTWDELAATGLVLLPQIEAAKQLDDKITGGAAPKE